MLWETSLLDPEEGIRFRGFSIPELQASNIAFSTMLLDELDSGQGLRT